MKWGLIYLWSLMLNTLSLVRGGAFAKIKLRNIRTGQVIEKTVKPSDKVEEVALEEAKAQNSYRSGDDLHFMDQTTFEEIVIPVSILGDKIKFLQDDLEVTVLRYKDEVLDVHFTNIYHCRNYTH